MPAMSKGNSHGLSHSTAGYRRSSYDCDTEDMTPPLSPLSSSFSHFPSQQPKAQLSEHFDFDTKTPYRIPPSPSATPSVKQQSWHGNHAILPTPHEDAHPTHTPESILHSRQQISPNYSINLDDMCQLASGRHLLQSVEGERAQPAAHSIRRHSISEPQSNQFTSSVSLYHLDPLADISSVYDDDNPTSPCDSFDNVIDFHEDSVFTCPTGSSYEKPLSVQTPSNHFVELSAASIAHAETSFLHELNHSLLSDLPPPTRTSSTPHPLAPFFPTTQHPNHYYSTIPHGKW